MKVELVIITLFAGLVVFSCKKKEKDPKPIPVNTPSAPNNDPIPSNATVFSGILTTGSYSYLAQSIYVTQRNGSAYFSSFPQPTINSVTGVSVNVVSLNGVPLDFSSSQSFYPYTSTLTTFESETWSVNGANGIGTFSFSNLAVEPSAAGMGNFPFNVSKSTGFTFTLNNVTSITNGSFTISDAGTPGASFTHTITSGDNVIHISPVDLAALGTTSAASVYVTLQNNKVFTISGKDYQFRKEIQFAALNVTINP